MKILIIDDDISCGQSLTEFLLKRGHFVKYCDNVIDSNHEIHNDRFDVALIDLMLPPTYTQEGIGVLATLRSIAPHTLIIMISIKTDKMTSIVAKAFSMGIHTFLDKNDYDFMEQLNNSIWEVQRKMSNKIFISHGHNDLLKLKLKDFIRNRLNRDTVILSELPNSGLTIVEKLEKASMSCNCAIVLLTKDDETKNGGMRARQNVIHEVGFFQGKYGRNKVILICEKGVDLFSNISGILRIEFDTNHFEAVYDSIRIEFESI